MLNWVHNEMEEVLLRAATGAGPEVRRGVRACDVRPAARPTVNVEQEGHVQELYTRLVVCADGRGSGARKWANFTVQQDSYGMLLAVFCSRECRTFHLIPTSVEPNPHGNRRLSGWNFSMGSKPSR
jgi:2-polyprenyl-6-methoxyphenol hydroxylase-like FAD-dependent oxidoreductase